jgi:serine/threonine protein kinase
MAPELLQGASSYDSKVANPLDAKVSPPFTPTAQVDVWSLGMLLYEMISRKIPYHGMSPGALPCSCSKLPFTPIPPFSFSHIASPHAIISPMAVAAAVAVVSQRSLPPLPPGVSEWVRACCR